jgi:membrane-associated phospholipid phosphatase
MNASDRLALRRNQMVFAWYTDRDTTKREQNGILSYDKLMTRIVGGIETPLSPPVLPLVPDLLGNYYVDGPIISALNGALSYVAAANLGPTRTSRFMYIWFASVAGAYNWAITDAPIGASVDNWNWATMKRPQDSSSRVRAWTRCAVATIMTSMVPSFDTNQLAAEERAAFDISESSQAYLEAFVKGAGDFAAWNAAWNAWYATRAADGNVAAAIPPSAADLPNGSTSLDVAATVDPATFVAPTKWTPLKIGSKTQKYLTYNWLDVTSTALTASDTSIINSAAASYFPSDADRVTEIDEVVNITATLTDSQKMIAEFWAGGPFTVSPPGMFIWMWKTYTRATRVAQNYGNTKFVFSGLDLAIHLFEMGHAVWGLKKAYMQARPIQEIRRLYRGQMIVGYAGLSVAGESWMPYQETDLVTPPFADFPSGHSAFSQSFANVMTEYFGESITSTEPINMDDLTLLSPTLQTQTAPFGQFTIVAGKSQIQNGIVPASSITLAWNTWADLATSAGVSRKYGGIHATSAHIGSVAAANALHTALKTRWAINVVS